MKYLTGIATSDWHFGGLQKHFSNHVERTVHELDKIYRYAIDNGIKHVFVPGDISDSPNMPWEIYIQLVLFLKKYDGIIHTHYICGNHDFSDLSKTSMDFLSVLQQQNFFKTFHLYLQAEQVVIDGVTVNFLPYPSTESLTSENPCLNFSHVTYNGALGDNGRKLRVKDEFIQDPRDYNISGHIHLYQHLKSKRAVYCGNPFQKNFGESLPKGFIHFRARQSSKSEVLEFKHKFVNNEPDFELRNLVINNTGDFAALKKSNGIRYKLFVDPSVLVPKNLLIEYPNITGGIFDIKGQKKAHEDEVVERTVSSINKVSSTNVRKGLTSFLLEKGLEKLHIKQAHLEVKKAMNELGI